MHQSCCLNDDYNHCETLSDRFVSVVMCCGELHHLSSSIVFVDGDGLNHLGAGFVLLSVRRIGI